MTTRSVLSSARCGARVLLLFFAAAVGVSLAAGCKSQVQETSIDIGGGMRKGDPPMCFQYRGEARPTMSAYNIMLHINNTCRYAVDCTFTDDVTQQEHRFVQPAYVAGSVLLAAESPAKRVTIRAECVWKP